MHRNFLVVGTQRTGSTALVRSLTFHPDIASAEEWTQHVPALRKLAFTERVLGGDFSELSSRQRSRIQPRFGPNTLWLGFKVLFRSSGKWLLHPRLAPALLLDRLEGFRSWLQRHPEISVIHVVREDEIDWLKSKYLADRSKVYAAGKEYSNEPLFIPVKEAMKRLGAKDWIDGRLAGLSATNRYLRVTYEEFLQSDRAVVSKLLGFLECDPARLGDFDYRKLQKQSKRSAREYISNYDELAVAVASRRRFLTC